MNKKFKLLGYIAFNFIVSMGIVYLSPRFDVITLFLFLLSGILLYLLLYYEDKKKDIAMDKELSNLFEMLYELDENLEKYQLKDSRFAKFKDELIKIIMEKKQESLASQKSRDTLKTYMEDIAHQIKTPLTGILLILDLMQEDKSNKEYIQVLRNDINRLYKLTDILLKMSSLDSGVTMMKKEVFSAKDLISEISLNLESYFIDKDLNIEVIGEDFELKLDRNWTLEAVFNIMKNGLEASLEKGIQIQLESNTIYQSIIVRDYGSGIHKASLQKMYQRFYKADPKSKGFGIGLSMAKAIVEKQNGEIFYKKEETSNYFEMRFYL